jgi:hypothetical protein
MMISDQGAATHVTTISPTTPALEYHGQSPTGPARLGYILVLVLSESDLVIVSWNYRAGGSPELEFGSRTLACGRLS